MVDLKSMCGVGVVEIFVVLLVLLCGKQAHLYLVLCNGVVCFCAVTVDVVQSRVLMQVIHAKNSESTRYLTTEQQGSLGKTKEQLCNELNRLFARDIFHGIASAIYSIPFSRRTV